MRENWERTETMVSDFFLFLSREDAPISVGKNTHIYPCWDGKAARKKDKAIKDLQQHRGDIFYWFPFSIQHTVRDQRQEQPVQEHMVQWWALLGAEQGLSWWDHTEQELTHLTLGVPAPRAGPLLLPHSALPRKATLELSVWDAAVPMEMALSHLLLSSPGAAHWFPHLSACCYSVQQTGEVTCVKITLSSTKAKSYF